MGATMDEQPAREHYIPLRKSELVDLLCAEPGLKDDEVRQFRDVARLIAATFHFEYHRSLEEFKDDYAPFNPDSTTRCLKQIPAEERARQLDRLFARFHWLMERANFVRLAEAALEEALRMTSDWGLNMAIDWNDFERLELFARGDTEGMRMRRNWWKPWRLESRRVAVFQRLVVIAKFKSTASVPATIDKDAVFLKIFKDIPKMDLEMLLPGARLQMPGMQRLKLGSSLISGLGLIGYQVGKQLLTVTAMSSALFWGPLAALFGYGYRQYYGYQSTKTACHLRLTQNLYYQNLDNNAGVLFHLLDEAEEQECREALLAYYYLYRCAGEQGWTAAVLDEHIEKELERLTKLRLDFEIDDALAKLVRLDLVTQESDRYRAVPLDKALEQLDYAWDNYFTYNNEAVNP
jgi:hypothetical protein